jgi:hypothetical protein
MDFSQVIFDKKTFADLLKEIHSNAKNKEKQIKALVEQLAPMITDSGSAILLVPLLKEYLDLGIKNDEHLIKMASIIQRAVTSAQSSGSGDIVLNDSEKEQLLAASRDLSKLN